MSQDGKMNLKVNVSPPRAKSPARAGDFTNSTSVQRQVRTETVGNTTKTIVVETIQNPDGSRTTTQREMTSTGKHDDDCCGQTERVQGGGASGGATSGGGSFNDEVVRSHNQYRRKHKVGDLRLNSELCVVATRWAEQLASISPINLQHNSAKFRGERMGENLAWRSDTRGFVYTGQEFVKRWCDEIKDYNFRNPESSGPGVYNHFTQVVWKGSKEIGVGKALSRDGTHVVVVCNYIPAGNMLGDYKKNVFP